VAQIRINRSPFLYKPEEPLIMTQPFKTLFISAGLLIGLWLVGPAHAAKPAAEPAATTAAVGAAADMTAAPVTAAAAAVPFEENPYGLSALWAQGDAVAKGTLLVLVLMSMGSWYVIFTKFAEQAKMNKQAKAAQDSFWSASTVVLGKDTLEEGSAFRFIAEKGLEGASKHTGLLGAVDFNEWVTMSIQRAIGKVQSRTQEGLAVLATVGSTAPFVGLFGTVWGIYHALVKIGMSGQASIDKVAGPVGESLIMTAIGLAVAVPAVLGYNWLVRRNKAVMEQVTAFGADLHAVLLGSAKK
jgi:biopolymer transport protein ExbB